MKLGWTKHSYVMPWNR